MAHKFLILTVVIFFAISATSAIPIVGNLGGLLSVDDIVKELQTVVNKVIQAIRLVGNVLDGKKTLDKGLEASLKNLIEALLPVLHIVLGLIATLLGVTAPIDQVPVPNVDLSTIVPAI